MNAGERPARAPLAVLVRVVSYLGAWFLIALFFASQTWLYGLYSGRANSFARALVYPLIDTALWAVLGLGAIALARRFPIERRTIGSRLALHAGAALVLAVVEGMLSYRVFVAAGLFAGSSGSTQDMTRNLTIGKLHTNLLVYAFLVGVVHLVETHRKYRDRQLAASRLETRLAQARLELLKSQLHPHFLFNSLNAVSALMHRDVETADRMLTRLGDLLRFAMESPAAQRVPLRREMEFVRGYLEIQQLRFGERLSVSLDVPDEALDAEVPHLALQPLVENAIRHGIAPRAGGGSVSVTARRHDGRLVIDVEDDGPGAPVPDPGAGLGLANTRARLEQLYGAAHRFAARNRGAGGFAVTLELPYRVMDQDEVEVTPGEDRA
jgi:signal transduction histidine kinase